MAYANLVAQGCINPKETFQRVRDFLCKRNGTYDYSSTGIGWTLHDAVYSVDEDNISDDDYFVVSSTGEDTERTLYFKFIINSINNYISVYGYLYWDSSAHTGTNEFGTDYSWYNPTATNNILWIYGDLDSVRLIAKYGTNYESCSFGWMPDSAYDTTVSAATSGAITAGSSVTVTFSAVPAEWAEDTYLFVYDEDYIERVQITGISGTDVTFATFVNSYAAASQFVLEMTNYVGNARSTFTVELLIGHDGDTGPIVSNYYWSSTGMTSAEELTGLYPAKSMYFYDPDFFIGPLKNQYVTISGFTSETTHTIGATGYRYFDLYSGVRALIKEV